MVVVTTLVILSLKLFDLVYVTTNGRFDTHVVATLFFQESFGPARDFGVGAALAVVLLLAVIPVMIISIRRFQLGGRADDNRSPARRAGGRHQPVVRDHLGGHVAGSCRGCLCTSS